MNFRQKSLMSIITIYLVLMLVYVVIPIVVPFAKSSASWIIYAATIFSIFLSFVILLISFKYKKTIKSLLYGVPIFRIGVIYLVLQIVTSIAIFIIDGIMGVPFWVSIILSILLLGLCVIGVAITDAQRNTIEKVEDKHELKISNFDEITRLFNLLLLTTVEDNCSGTITSIKDSFKYSDPVSNENTLALEKRIINKLNNLISLAELEEWESITIEVEQLGMLIKERNILVSRKVR